MMVVKEAKGESGVRVMFRVFNPISERKLLRMMTVRIDSMLVNQP